MMKIVVFSSSRHQRWAKLISQFLSGQIIIQLLNFATGFLLLRWLSVTEYAQFSVAFAFQSTLGMLIDLGFSSSIIALVGDRGSDSEVVGRYIRSARYFRNRMFVAMLCVAAVAFPLVTQHQHWPASTKLLLFGAIVTSVFFQGWAMYAAPLLINGRIKEFYQAQILSAAGRLCCCFVLFEAVALSAWAAAWAAAAALAVTGLLYRKKSNHLVAEPAKCDPLFNKEMLRYLVPLMPVAVFTALQGQVTILLVTCFGRSETIANIAALGRLSQLFLILGAFNSVIVEPYFAKITHARLAARYAQTILVAVGVAAIAASGAFFLPQPLLWLLGSKYQSLGSYVGWIVGIACVNYIAGVLFTINSARKWRFWWYSCLEIPLILVAQALALTLTHVGTMRGAIAFSLMTNIGWMLTHLTVGVYGLLQTQHNLKHSNRESRDSDAPDLKVQSSVT